MYVEDLSQCLKVELDFIVIFVLCILVEWVEIIKILR